MAEVEKKTKLARTLRRKATEAGTVLGQTLRARTLAGLKFRRQVPLGPYTVDFLCASMRLVVELDGDVHAFQVDPDAKRQDWLESQGFQVLRFWNSEVLSNLDGVVETIIRNYRNRLNDPPETWT